MIKGLILFTALLFTSFISTATLEDLGDGVYGVIPSSGPIEDNSFCFNPLSYDPPAQLALPVFSRPEFILPVSVRIEHSCKEPDFRPVGSNGYTIPFCTIIFHAELEQIKSEMVGANYNASRYQDLTNAQHTPPYVESYTVQREAQQVLKACSLNKARFENLYGNVAQHQLHQELLNIVQKTGVLYQRLPTPEKESLTFLCRKITRMADVGVEANWKGKLQMGYAIADWCYYAVQCTAEVVKGIGDGVLAASAYVIDHPLEAAATIIAPEVIVMYHLIPLSYELGKFCGTLTRHTIACVHTKEHGLEDIKEFLEPLTTMRDHFHATYREAGWRKFIRPVMCFITDFTLAQKISCQAGELYERAVHKTLASFKKGVPVFEMRRFALPGGNSTEIVKEGERLYFAKKSTSKPRNSLGSKPPPDLGARYKLPRAQSKIDFFRETPFGRELYKRLEVVSRKSNNHDGYYVKENYKHLEKGNFIYFDMMHKDHLEVFDAQGKSRGVMNLDGSWNTKKSERAKGRKIDV